jgi:DNA-binding HxlR family transcriptional regulator
METTAIKKLKNQIVCPIEVALRILGGKWRLRSAGFVILRNLNSQRQAFIHIPVHF